MTHAPILVGGPLPLNEPRSVSKLPHRKVQGQRGSIFEILIANRILEARVTHSKQTMAPPPNREKFRGFALQRSAVRSHVGVQGEEKAHRNIRQFRNRTKSLQTLDITFF